MADATDRRLYLVELDLRGLSSPQLAGVQRALDEAVRRENRRGSKIRYLQCIYAPDEQRCLCLFEAAGPDQVRSVNDIARPAITPRPLGLHPRHGPRADHRRGRRRGRGPARAGGAAVPAVQAARRRASLQRRRQPLRRPYDATVSRPHPWMHHPARPAPARQPGRPLQLAAAEGILAPAEIKTAC